MTSQNVLITGGYGCIGAETAKWLAANSDAAIIIASRTVSEERSERVFHGGDTSRFTFIEADVRDQRQLETILIEHQITHVIHMAALQTPDCNAHRDLGLQINLAGTQNLIEAMKGCGREFQRFIFASSIAVYGPRANYPGGRVQMLAEPQPVNVYGTWKLAGESLARFFHQDTGVATISLRPGVLFGPGRDVGLTSSPTTAIKCVALGLPYEIPFRSRQDYQYAPDVGAAVGHATLQPCAGYGVFTLPGQSLDTQAIVSELKIVAEQLGVGEAFQITIGGDEVPFICDLESEPFCKAFPNTSPTPLREALRQSLQVYLDQANRGWLTPESVC